MPLSRRQFLAALSSTSFIVSVHGSQAEPVAPQAADVSLSFPQGVASGDPQSDSVILWTRAEPKTPGLVNLQLQLAEDEDFASLLATQDVSTGPESDYTLRTHVVGLESDRWYFYRFVSASGATSRTGRTRTAPRPDRAKDLRLAFASCQSYEQSYYGSWARMLADDLAAPPGEQLDAVLHVGDFIYERCWHRRIDGGEQARKVPPFPDGVMGEENRYALTLADYRHLYKTYLADPHLQAARARWPFIVTWDDHEFSNNNYQSYSTYGSDIRLEARRRLDANRCWFEFMPAALDELEEQPAYGFRATELAGDEGDNRLAADSLLIYRRLSWGALLDIVITDNRSYRSPPCVPDDLPAALDLPLTTSRLVSITDAGREYNDGQPPEFLPYGSGDVPNPARKRAPGTCLGEAQRDWFLNALAASDKPWKIWANSLPLIPLNLDLSAIPFGGLEDSVISTDAWVGYPWEMSLLVRELWSQQVGGVVSLSGDHHMHGAGGIRHSMADAEAPEVLLDFNVAALASSPLYGDLYMAASESPEFMALVAKETDGVREPTWHNTLLRGSLSSLAYERTGLKTVSQWLGPNAANPGLRFVDTTHQGYGIAHFSANRLKVQLVGVERTLEAFTEPPPVIYTARFDVPAWQGGESPVLNGPAFTGQPPFPYG
ncbi:MAG: alkaline phosphatase D family protein [Pseudomonadota bacterium]